MYDSKIAFLKKFFLFPLISVITIFGGYIIKQGRIALVDKLTSVVSRIFSLFARGEGGYVE